MQLLPRNAQTTDPDSGPVIEAVLFGLHAALNDSALVRSLRRHAIATAVITGTQPCSDVLQTAGLTQLFDIQFATIDDAAQRLNVPAARIAIVQDSVSEIQASAHRGFGQVVGVSSHGAPEMLALKRAGASYVIADLAELALEPAGPGRGRLVRAGGPFCRLPKPPTTPRRDDWIWSYDSLDPAREGTRETLCTLGNGYFATRGAAPESQQDDVHYPGTYVAGCANRLTTPLGDEQMENESIVNLPNWLVMRFGIGEDDWLEPETAQVSSYVQEVDLARGVFRRQMRLTDTHDRRTLLSEQRIVSMAQPHLAAQNFEISATNWSGEVRVLAALDAGVANLNVRDDRAFNSQHLVYASGRQINSESLSIEVETSQSRIRVHEVARIRVTVGGRRIEPDQRLVQEPSFIAQELRFHLSEGQTATIEKIISLYTSRDPAISEPGAAAVQSASAAGSFDDLLVAHVAAWERLWSRSGVDVGDEHANRILRLHAFHVLQTLSRQTLSLDVGAPARGLHGEGYRGHIFWDDVLVLPVLTYRLPELTKHMLGYRFRRLEAARRLAAEDGRPGALFPWQSGSDGREETPTWIFNPRSERWFADHSRLQRHVSLAVAYEVWQYYEITNDLEFLVNVGAELLIGIARYFSSLATFNPERGRYEIRGVMGPDEFHDGYPGADRPGLDNNAYTNVMVVWLMRRAIDALAILRGYYSDELISVLDVVSAETE
ncbi:MAG: hypothetical protein JOZ81_23290 [Chloroflexi bacterium]|nr:hypothetical protein [Chloroflexota bacterium]